MASMNLPRISRLVKLIGLLQAGRGWNVNALAAECRVSRRTIFRDFEVLREAGVPLAFDERDECYRIPATFYMPPTHFTAAEAMAVMVLCHEFGGGKLPYYAAARSAAVKLESSLPVPLRDYLQSLGGAVRINLPAVQTAAGGDQTYEQLLNAIASHCCVRIDYSSIAERKVVCTRLSPFRLLFSRHSWYVIGRSSLHRATRTFHVGRIQNLTPLESTYEIPKGFKIERYLRNAWHLIPEKGPDREIEIRFSPLVARNVAEVLWHKTQRSEFLPDGSLNFRATVSGIEEISWWVLGYGDQAEVLAPHDLRIRVAARARNMLKQYDLPAENATVVSLKERFA